MKRSLALCLSVILALSISGCIDVELARNVLVVETEPVMEYAWSNITATYTFDTSFMDPNTMVHENATKFTVKNGTEYIDINAWVRMDKLPANMDDMVEQYTQIRRHVNISVLDPDLNLMRFHEFNTTESEYRLGKIDQPAEGEWTLLIRAEGISFDIGDFLRYHDAYTIKLGRWEPRGSTPV